MLSKAAAATVVDGDNTANSVYLKFNASLDGIKIEKKL